jgi:hypothetical protein
MIKPFRFLLSTLVLISTVYFLPAQNQKITVAGTVADAMTGQPLSDVNISIVGTSRGGTTNQAGEFALSLNRIPAVLYFSHMGYSIGSYQVEKTREKNIWILLEPETVEVEEVTIRAEKVSKVIRGDTLNILDYELSGNRIFLLASPYKNPNNMRIYLATLNGDTLNHVAVNKAGKQIKFPEDLMPHTEYLTRDFTGQVQFLDKSSAHEVLCKNDRLSFGYDTNYADFIGRLLAIKCEMMGRLIFQVSNQTENYTLYFGRGARDGESIKYINDKKGGDRYVGLKCVSAPLFRKGNELFIFDFFGSNFEVFNSNLKSIRTIPITFQNRTIRDWLIMESQDVDVRNFTQTIFFDEKSGKAYAFFRLRSYNRQSLREVNLETGEIHRMIEIPDFPNISNIRVYDNTVYFLYDTKTYPYYRLLYRMAI